MPPWPPWSVLLPGVEVTEAPPTPASQPGRGPVTVVPPRAKVPPPAVVPPGRALFPPKSVAPPMAGAPAVVPVAPPAAVMPPAAPPISPVDVPSGTVVLGLDSASSLPPAAPAFPLDGLRGSRPLLLSVHAMDRVSATVARISVLERMVSPACNHGKRGECFVATVVRKLCPTSGRAARITANDLFPALVASCCRDRLTFITSPARTLASAELIVLFDGGWLE